MHKVFLSLENQNRDKTNILRNEHLASQKVNWLANLPSKTEHSQQTEKKLKIVTNLFFVPLNCGVGSADAGCFIRVPVSFGDSNFLWGVSATIDSSAQVVSGKFSSSSLWGVGSQDDPFDFSNTTV